jgi:tetratricopeptide (TPR) repeat protein
MSVQPTSNSTPFANNTPSAQPIKKMDSEPPETAFEEAITLAPLIVAPAPAPQYEVRDEQAPLELFTQSMDYTTPTCLDNPALVEHHVLQIRKEIRMSQRSELPPLYFELACCLMAQKNYAEAKGYLKLVHTDAAILAMASCFFYEGKYALAISHCEPLSLMYTSAQFKLGCCYAKLGNYALANQCFLLVNKGHSAFGHAQFNVGSDFYRRGEYTAALIYFNNTLNAGGDNPDAANYYSGLCLTKLDEGCKAIEHFSQIKNERSPYYQAAQKKLEELRKTANVYTPET